MRAKIVKLMGEVEELRTAPMLVEQRDEILFLPTNIPKPEDGEQRIRDWMGAVKSAKNRQERRRRKEDQILVREMMRFGT